MSDCCWRRITIRQPGGGHDVYLKQLAESDRSASIISFSRARIKGWGSHREQETLLNVAFPCVLMKKEKSPQSCDAGCVGVCPLTACPGRLALSRPVPNAYPDPD